MFWLGIVINCTKAFPMYDFCCLAVSIISITLLCWFPAYQAFVSKRCKTSIHLFDVRMTSSVHCLFFILLYVQTNFSNIANTTFSGVKPSVCPCVGHLARPFKQRSVKLPDIPSYNKHSAIPEGIFVQGMNTYWIHLYENTNERMV